MKRYRVTIDGRVYDVEIDDPRARPVTARLAGTAYSVDVEAGPPAETTAPDVTTPAGGDPASPAADARPPAAPRPAETPVPAAAPAGTGGPGPQGMTAPIPGVVSTVAVRPGQPVERGDELLTIEAMKMFNVMRSPRSGTVTTVHVKDGDRVVQGQPLVTFAP